MAITFILVVLLIGLIVLPLVSIAGTQRNSIKMDELEKELKQLKTQLANYQSEKSKDSAKEEIKKEIFSTPELKTEDIPVAKETVIKEAIAIDSIPKFESSGKKIAPVKSDFYDKITEQIRSMTSSEWETLIGGKILNRIGALAVIIGVGFFLKYAFDNNWITETMRVLIGLAIGFLLLFGGHYYHKKGFLIFSRGLIGAGIAILYLSVYASFNYYHLVSQIVAFAMMIVVTIISFWQAIKYNSLIISLFGWLGATLTPFLLSTGTASESGLLSYVAFLDVGLLYIAMKKERWLILEPLSLLSTILIYSSWNWSYFLPDMCLETSLFLFLLWAIFLASEIIKISSLKRKITLVDQGISLTNGGFFYLSLYWAVNPSHHQLMGVLTIVVAAAYLGIYFLTRKKRQGEEYLLTRYLFSTLLLSVCASFIQFKNFEITIALSIESFLLTWIARKDKNILLNLASIAILILSIFNFLFIPTAFNIDAKEFCLLFNMRSAALISVLLSAFGSGTSIRINDFKFSNIIKPALTYTWIAVLFTLITVETSDLFDCLWTNSIGSIQTFYIDNSICVLVLEWIILSLLLFYYSFKRQFIPHLYSSFIITALILFFSVINGFLKFSPLSMFLPLINIRSIALLIVCTLLWLMLATIRRENYNFRKTFEKIAGISIALLLFILLTSDTRDIFGKKIDSFSEKDSTQLLTSTVYLMQLCLSGIWLLYSITLMIAGIYKRNFGIRIISIVLFGITILKIFFYDLSNLDTLHRIFSFIGLGFTLLSVSYLYHKYKHLILPEKLAVKNPT